MSAAVRSASRIAVPNSGGWRGLRCHPRSISSPVPTAGGEPAPRQERRRAARGSPGSASPSRWWRSPAWSGGRRSRTRRELPSSRAELAALLGAIALYALATVVRAERWQRLLVDEGGDAPRGDTYALTCIGYMGNNVLPARAGDAIRVVLMAPRAGHVEAHRDRHAAGRAGARRRGARRAVRRRRLRRARRGRRRQRRDHRARRRRARRSPARSRYLPCAATAPARVRRADRVGDARRCAAPTTGSLLLAMTLADLGDRGRRVDAVGAAVGLRHGPDRGAVHRRAGVSVFSLIPSGPGYAGTQDTAASSASRRWAARARRPSPTW